MTILGNQIMAAMGRVYRAEKKPGTIKDLDKKLKRELGGNLHREATNGIPTQSGPRKKVS